eukprot:RCo039202
MLADSFPCTGASLGTHSHHTAVKAGPCRAQARQRALERYWDSLHGRRADRLRAARQHISSCSAGSSSSGGGSNLDSGCRNISGEEGAHHLASAAGCHRPTTAQQRELCSSVLTAMRTEEGWDLSNEEEEGLLLELMAEVQAATDAERERELREAEAYLEAENQALEAQLRLLP